MEKVKVVVVENSIKILQLQQQLKQLLAHQNETRECEVRQNLARLKEARPYEAIGN